MGKSISKHEKEDQNLKQINKKASSFEDKEATSSEDPNNVSNHKISQNHSEDPDSSSLIRLNQESKDEFDFEQEKESNGVLHFSGSGGCVHIYEFKQMDQETALEIVDVFKAHPILFQLDDQDL